MSDHERLKDFVKALALGDVATSQRLGPQLLEGDTKYLGLYVTAASSLFIDRHFSGDHSLETIKDFAVEMRDQFQKADPPVKPLHVEAVIRAVWGEDHLLDDIRGRDQYSTHVAMIRKVGFDSEDIRANIDAILDEAEELTDEWTS
ncbi:hypothetical protein [Natronoglycomyces albus]|uniref:Uncharacterized protein n=1 Tax=Natronoglycomyces albus TaxID=2811108 RepID=A0A895XNK0_9ACTN|nr:hypothetical protein [Natronoglycomyces albus]QSB05352.1 hypothetical protein JQS30_16655 [Natronoglycomyces albus]